MFREKGKGQSREHSFSKCQYPRKQSRSSGAILVGLHVSHVIQSNTASRWRA